LLVYTAPSTSTFYTLSLHDALPIYAPRKGFPGQRSRQRRHLRTCEGRLYGRSRRRGRLSSRFTGGCAAGARCRTADEHAAAFPRSEEHTSELQSRGHLVCRLLLEKK